MLSKIKSIAKKFFLPTLTKEDLNNSRPFTSQNTWEIVSKFYMSLPEAPRILEYGSGISTFYHLKNLEEKGGELVSVEHDPSWFRMLNKTLSKEFKSSKKVKFKYLLRKNHGRTGCGTFEEFKDYVTAPEGKFDVIIVDGRARKACVNYVLDNNLLKKGGMMVLFEAGRGNGVWPKKNQMSDTYDYKPEVNRMIKLGGKIIDGDGYEKWDGWKPNRPTTEAFAKGVPAEICYFIS